MSNKLCLSASVQKHERHALLAFMLIILALFAFFTPVLFPLMPIAQSTGIAIIVAPMLTVAAMVAIGRL